MSDFLFVLGLAWGKTVEKFFRSELKISGFQGATWNYTGICLAFSCTRQAFGPCPVLQKNFKEMNIISVLTPFYNRFLLKRNT